MTFTPVSDIRPNTLAFENEALVAPTGFREYDARWLYPEEINLLGMQALGLGLGTYLHEQGVAAKIVVGHDYRSYSLTIKQALTLGLMSAGCEVHDIGLALSPVAYFAQFALDVPAVAMIRTEASGTAICPARGQHSLSPTRGRYRAPRSPAIQATQPT